MMLSQLLPRRFALAEYHRLVELGFFQEDEAIELIRGEIIQMAAKGMAHEVCITRLLRELPKLLGDRATLRCQAPITLLGHSEPEPDLAIVKNRTDDYLSAHPTAVDIELIIEVADSSIQYDQTVKLKLYAEAGIAHYWIFNLSDRYLEIYSQPSSINSAEFSYLNKQIFLPTSTIGLPQYPDSILDLAKIFPNV